LKHAIQFDCMFYQLTVNFILKITFSILMSWRSMYVNGSLSVKKNNREYINELRLK
jgi:hypothetical protein